MLGASYRITTNKQGIIRRDPKFLTRKRKSTRSPVRSNYFLAALTRREHLPPEETTQQKLSKVPLEQDETFLKAVKAELLGLRKRVRHETLQKLELLKQMKQYREKEANQQKAAAVAAEKDTVNDN